MFKRSVFLGAVSGILAGIACIIYANVYSAALDVDFSKVVNPLGMMASCLFGSLLAAIGYFIFYAIYQE